MDEDSRFLLCRFADCGSFGRTGCDFWKETRLLSFSNVLCHSSVIRYLLDDELSLLLVTSQI